MIRVVVGTSETSHQLAEHFIKMLAYTGKGSILKYSPRKYFYYCFLFQKGNSLNVLRTRHSRGRLSDAVFECCNLHEDVIPMGLSAVVMTEILEKYFSSYST